ncbi:hypothetical protein C2S53_013604 [Perilla frutescens var. hirtella]|uniref:Uncharacterized protein n=1 Tax=Perilla frutescens var. hirtella TaxID=608512 RepID=A0AAD4IZJ8_PERFH|nr:hypothetical protein C2S53_013604 [Perilla frutescens var. hirtella]
MSDSEQTDISSPELRITEAPVAKGASTSRAKRLGDKSSEATSPPPKCSNSEAPSTVVVSQPSSTPVVINVDASRPPCKNPSGSSAKLVPLKSFLMEFQKSVTDNSTPEDFKKESLDQFLLRQHLTTQADELQRVSELSEKLEKVVEERRDMAVRESVLFDERDAAQALATSAQAVLERNLELQTITEREKSALQVRLKFGPYKEAFYQEGKRTVVKEIKERLPDPDLSFFEFEDGAEARKETRVTEIVVEAGEEAAVDEA